VNSPVQETQSPVRVLSNGAPWAVHFKREALKWARTLHIYLSLSAFAMFLFFAVTGVMLVHDSFGLDQVKTSTAEHTFSRAIASSRDQQALVDAIRSAFAIHLPITQFTDGDDQIEVSFAGPARRAQVIIRRDDGSAEATFDTRGLVGVIADLHKGAETGWVWRGLLDIVSVWIGLSSLTGLIMLLALPKRRRLGVIVAVFGAIFALAAYAVYVPR
jgi:hypothetical protein